VIFSFILFWLIIQNRMLFVPLNALQQAILSVKSDILGGYTKPEQEIQGAEGISLSTPNRQIDP
jgi:hypothetical protein